MEIFSQMLQRPETLQVFLPHLFSRLRNISRLLTVNVDHSKLLHYCPLALHPEMYLPGTLRALQVQNNLLKSRYKLPRMQRKALLHAVEVWHTAEEANLPLIQSSIKHTVREIWGKICAPLCKTSCKGDTHVSPWISHPAPQRLMRHSRHEVISEMRTGLQEQIDPGLPFGSQMLTDSRLITVGFEFLSRQFKQARAGSSANA